MEREGGLRVSVLDNGGIVKVNKLDKRLVQTEKGEGGTYFQEARPWVTLKLPFLGGIGLSSNVHSQS